MNTNLYVGLINNSALLMALIVIYELSYLINDRWKRSVPVINGLLIGLIGLAIMSVPLHLKSGILFDTRSILLGVTALTFGAIPSIIAGIILIFYRLFIGGAGAIAGCAIILSSCLIGILWRRLNLPDRKKCKWLNIYVFGILLHLGMLSCVFILPWPQPLEVLAEVSIPIMLLYPVVTVLLSMILLHQKYRKEARQMIEEAEGRYASIFNNNYAVMLLIDPETADIVDANLAAVEFYGWPIETLKTMKISEINTLGEAGVKANLSNSVHMKQNHFFFQHRTASGREIDVEVYSGPLMINGKTINYSIVHDVSESAAATKALQESEERFRLLIESAPEAIFIQTDGKFSFLNRFAVSLFGAQSERELLGTSVMERFHPAYQEVIRERIHQLNQGKKAVPSNEEVFIKLDGTPVDVDVTAVPLHYQNLDGALVFARDITERKRLEHAKNEVEAQLRQQQKLEAIGTLAGGVAHEINNPINGIMNYAQLILDLSGDGNEAISEYAGEILQETDRVATIVKNLLQFSRQEKQSHSYASIYDIINQTISLINTVVKRDQITLEVELEENLPDIKCRSQQIQQVLMNLMTNARDALNEKYRDYDEDKIIRLSCTHFFEAERRWMKIIVEDHGNGIPDNIREKIFEPFFSTKPKETGTGLGLSISFGIVKDHHGSITIDTKEGFYTKCILILPVDNGWSL
ncbi:MAG: putative sensor histidine kinase [Bacillota bacterium]|jgi:PAS domain S-box-containing protein|nr:putative sensor histidine kinase [Bacillota bacterium]